MNVFLAGQKAFGAAAFGMFARLGVPVTGVAAPAVRPDRLRAADEDAGVPWLPSGTLWAETQPAGTDLIVCAHAHEFVGRRTRMPATFGGVGYHPSLPRHRGRDAVRWTINMKDPDGGGTV